MLEYVTCNLCGRNDTTQLYKMGKVEIVQCNHCGLVYTNPRLSEDERLKLYDADYFAGKKSRPDLTGGAYDYSDDYSVGYYTGQLRLRKLLRYKRPPGKILEIGVGNGTFLKVAQQKGWQVHGVDISEIAGSYCREKLGLEVFIGQLEDAPFAPESFDVICMYHLLEHIPSPKEYCQRLHRLLKQDGLLVVEVPDISSSIARRLKTSWWALQPYIHLFHFSRETLNDLLSQTGYEIIGTSWWGPTGFMIKRDSQFGIRQVIRNFLVKHLRYFNWFRRVINFTQVQLFKRYDAITVYAQRVN